MYPFPPAGDDSDWSDIHGDCGKGKITDVEVKIEIKNDTSLYQAVCNAPTPLGPRGMFGAIEQGQEEAVKFYQAWKAEVVLDIYSRYLNTFFNLSMGTLNLRHRW